MNAVKYSNQGEKIGKKVLPKSLFGSDINEAVLYEVINLYLRNQRQGTKSVKKRSEVKASSRKLHRQKGTGRARSGGANSPTRIGGGVAFAPEPKNWHKKIPKKKKRIALKSALSNLKKNVVIIEDFELEKPSTKNALNILKKMKIDFNKCLIIIPDNSKNIINSFNNLKDFRTLRAQDINAYEILNSNNLIITENALKKMEETFNE